jgi:ATPase family associated with various cellular activities (AAA)
MGTTMNSTTTDLQLPSARSQRRLDDAWPQSMARGLFVAEMLQRQLTHVARDELQGTAAPALLAQLGEPVLVRGDRDADEVEALLRMDAGCIALIECDHADLSLEVAGAERERVEAAAGRLRTALAVEPPRREQASVAFWMRGERGGRVRHREIDAPTFDAIAGNYARSVRTTLGRLIETREPASGRLLLWRGAPGTGKSHALRALVRAWEPWCSAHFIIDPEELFGSAGAYLLDLLTWDGDHARRWRLVILEDAGELIASDARSLTGQALSRLLNVADGLLGQGTHTLVLITTNEPVKRLHPATRRAGRCLADIEFVPLSVEDANAWLAAHGLERRVGQPTTIAELFAGTAHAPDTTEPDRAVPFGFARALSRS